jgi:hypothetical protein
VSPTRRAVCDRIVGSLKRGAALSRELLAAVTSDSPAGGPPGPRTLPQVRDAIQCIAVARDDASLCDSLTGASIESCRRSLAYFRWARRPVIDQGWRCDEHGRKKCLRKGHSPAECDAMCLALRTSDPTKCPPRESEELDGCRAMASGDPAHCKGRHFCVEEVARVKALTTGGLKARLAVAKGEEKTLIEAALKGTPACGSTLDELRVACVSQPESPAPAAPTSPRGPAAKR